MNILVVYATNSGGTLEVSQTIAETLTKHRHTVTVQHAHDTHVRDFSKYPLVILGSCTWERFEGNKKIEGQLQQHMYALAFQLRGHSYPDTKFAVYGLGDSSYTEFCVAADHLEQLVSDLKGQKVGSTMRIDGYFFDLPKYRQVAEDWAEEIIKAV